MRLPLLPKMPSDASSGVGGRLCHFIKEWAEISNNSFILQTLEKGYSLEFKSLPPQRFFLTHLPRDQETRSHDKFDFCMGVISPVPENQKFRGFYSHVFLVKKASGGFRMVINLSVLNKYIVYRRFRMENIYSVRNLLLPMVFMVTLDLQDAYLHVPICQSY